MADYQKPADTRFVKFFACANGFIAVAMGAVAAHALADPHAAELAQKASAYQLTHALLLLVLAPYTGKIFAAARLAIAVGLVFFCGALYVYALTGFEPVIHLVPIGGICFMLGWLLAAYAFIKEGKQNG